MTETAGDRDSRDRTSTSARAASLVALGILLSRVSGLVRARVFAHYFGLTAPADAFSAALRIPNVLNNLFGEGALSGSFIPVYAALVARGDRREADRVAGAIASILGVAMAVLVLVGVLATPIFVDLIAPGFQGDTRTLTISLVRIIFPGIGLTVMSAWCLGVLNSHRRFLLSYSVPVVWNGAMIVTLLAFGAGRDLPDLAKILAWGSVVGSALMVVVQMPTVLRVAPHLRFAFDTSSSHVRVITRNFGGVFLSRGVVQVSGYVDTLIASLVSTGATTAFLNAQTLYMLPLSLFGMSVSAAELPAMSGEADASLAAVPEPQPAGTLAQPAGVERHDALRKRLDGGLRRIAFFVVPSAAAFVVLGDVIVAALFQTGRFGRSDVMFVWAILAGFAIGLLASTLGRLYSSAFFALRDTRTPLRIAVLRIALSTALGYVCAIQAPRWLGLAPMWGAAGLTASGGAAGWIELVLLRRKLNGRVGRTGLDAGYVTRLWTAAIASAALSWAIKGQLPESMPPLVVAAVVLTPYLASFVVVARVIGVPLPAIPTLSWPRRP